ncbi:MAG: polymer-forming cytoskeletal protein, partial [Anaerolineales bacterium]|nr:polymer-forming cytoskeletal protein [Anaerolineales bacterium]
IAQKVEIRATGRIWGDVVTVSFATEEGAFLRGQIRMEDAVELDLGPESSDQSSVISDQSTAKVS